MTGLIRLHLAAHLEPQDTLLAKRRNVGAQLGLQVVLGFLLLVPLLSDEALGQQEQRSNSQAAVVRRTASNLQQLRQVVASAANTTELHDRLIAINGPVLDAADHAKPLPVIKAQVSSLFDQAAADVERQQQRFPVANPLQLLPELLRNAFASFALALGFAGLARWPNSEVSVWAVVQDWLEEQRQRRLTLCHRLGNGESDQDFMHELCQAEESDPPSMRCVQSRGAAGAGGSFGIVSLLNSRPVAAALP